MAILENTLIDINIAHLPLYTRIAAANWCFEKFGYDTVDIWSDVPSFRFKSQKDANWFLLRWS